MAVALVYLPRILMVPGEFPQPTFVSAKRPRRRRTGAAGVFPFRRCGHAVHLRSFRPIQTADHFLRIKEQLGAVKTKPDVRKLLALSYLRLGEQENCLQRHTAESCLFPIGGAGVHTEQRGARAALDEFTAILRDDPDEMTARWLINIVYMVLDEYPDAVPQRWLIPPEAFDSDYDLKRFRDIAPHLGLDAVSLAGGSIAEDFDRDGDLDLMASSWGVRDPLRYFRNNGDGTFTERTLEAGLKGIVGGLQTVHADYDNNGYADVLVLRGAWWEEDGLHPNSLLRNNGDGTFDDVTEEAGLLTFHPTQTAAWGDYDNDGWIDLYIGNESYQGNIHPCQLFHNNGDGTFTDVAAETGTAVSGYVKGVVWGDYDNDGWIDLYISRLTDSNILLKNMGKSASDPRTFADVSEEAGVGEPVWSFPAWFWDYDNDGWTDLFVSGYHADAGDIAAEYLSLPHDAEFPRLYRNNGDGTFSDVARQVGLDKVFYTMGCNFGDLDNDGDQDIYAVIGGSYAGDLSQNVLFENPGHGNHWLTLQLEGVRSNRAAIGARVKVRVNTRERTRDIYVTVTTGASFGASSLQQEIGLGRATSIASVEVIWPATGEKQVFTGLVLDRVYRIREGDPVPVPVELKQFDLSPDDAEVAQSAEGHRH